MRQLRVTIIYNYLTSQKIVSYREVMGCYCLYR